MPRQKGDSTNCQVELGQVLHCGGLEQDFEINLVFSLKKGRCTAIQAGGKQMKLRQITGVFQKTHLSCLCPCLIPVMAHYL